jgi:xanthine dehydrogenase accessory factor
MDRLLCERAVHVLLSIESSDRIETVEPLLAEIVRRCRGGERVALCVVVATRGSTPQQAGAAMLVTADGRTFGTLGGGCVEAEVRKTALTMLVASESRLIEFALDHDYGWDDGLICGGVMDVHIESILPGAEQRFVDLHEAVQQRRQASFTIAYEQAGEQKEFSRDLGPGPMLFIAGAGHVAQAVADLAAKLDFRVTVIDDREDFASESRFPLAERRIVGPIDDELRKCQIDAESFVVIVTRGHARDGAALAAVIDSPARYIGLIGSKRKIKTIFDDLHAQGVPVSRLKRVNAPIGLDIGAISVNEIAVSIVAEMIATRHGRLECPIRPMKMDAAEIEKWVTRKERGVIPPPQEHL